MKINPKLKMRVIAGEAIVLLSGKGNRDLTKVLALNPTSRFLWENLAGKEDFSEEDAIALLTENYEVKPEQAAEDVKKWIAQLRELSVVE